MGDFVVSWPLAMACCRVMPQNRVIYVTAGQKGKLAEHVLGVESIDIESGFASLWQGADGAPENVRKLVAGAAMIFSFGTHDDDQWSAAVRAIAPEARLIHLTTKCPDAFAGHVARYMVEQIKAVQPAVAAAVGQMVSALFRRGYGSRSVLRDGVLLHPGSGAERKNWPRERFVELGTALVQSGHSVRYILGEVEREKWGKAVWEEFASVGTVVQPATLVDLGRLLGNAAAVVCNDSGPAHVSAALGVPTVAIFGPASNAEQWSPTGPAVSVVTTPSLAELGTPRVLAEVSELLARASAGARSVEAPSSDE